MIGESMKKIIAFAIVCPLLAGLATAPAAAGDDGGFKLWVKPVSLWVLESDIDTNSSKFQEYLDLSSGLWAGLNIYGEDEAGDRTLALRMQAIGRDHARYQMDYALAGKYSFELDYNKIPHKFGNDATLLWNQTAVNRLELPDSMQASILDSLLNHQGFVSHGFLSGLLEPYFATANKIDLGLQRNRTRARFDLGKMGKTAWAFEYNHENRDGYRPLGASFGFFNVQEIPEPIRYATASAEISSEINGKNGGLRFGFRHSTFENDLQSVIWDNPFRSFDSTDGRAYLGPVLTKNGPALGRTALPPDNESNLLFVDGRGRTGAWWYNGSLTYNKMTQDESLLPLTINTAIVGAYPDGGQEFIPAAGGGLPVSSADREVEVMRVAGNAGRKLGENFDLTLRYRTYDYDTGGRRLEFPGYVRMDAVWEPIPLLTVPYAYTKDNLGIELDWDVSDNTQLTLAYLMESWDRSLREIEESDEDIIKLSVDSRPNQKVAIRGSWATGDRSTSHYDVEAQEVYFVHPEGINNQPALRKFDEAVRDVDDYDLSLQFFPADAWNLSFGFSGRDEDYPDSVFGLQSDELSNVNFELGYAPGANLNFYIFGHTAARDVFQRARQSGGTLSTDPANDWSVALNEDTTTWGLGLNAKNDNGWSWDLGAHISDTDGEADFETPAGGSPSAAVDFDNYEDIELFSAWFKLGYELSKHASFGLFYLYEDYTIDSFIQAGVVPYLPSSILLAPNDGDYQGDLFGINLRLTF